MKVIRTTIKGKVEKKKSLTMEQAVAEALIGHPKNTGQQVEDALKKGIKLQGAQGTFYQIEAGYQGEHGEYKDSVSKKKRKDKGMIVKLEDDETTCTPEGLAERLNTTSFKVRKAVRSLKLKRTGKFWNWDKEKDAETIARITAAVKAAEAPKVSKLVKKAEVALKGEDVPLEEEEAVDEEEE